MALTQLSGLRLERGALKCTDWCISAMLRWVCGMF